MRALEDIAVRERDVLQAYAPGAVPERSDVAQKSASSFALDPLSAVAPANAYFITRDERGRLLFTRDGTFSLRDGAVVDERGREVLGFRDDGATLAPLHADTVDVALELTSGARIEANGAVTYDRTTIDPRTGVQHAERVTFGRLALARFTPGTKLQSVDPQCLAAPANVAPHIGRAGDGNFDALQPFARENSGVNIDLGLQRLQEAYLALDAIRAAGKAQSSVEKTAMDLLK
jgi:flagellar basal body rod protein FlgG